MWATHSYIQAQHIDQYSQSPRATEDIQWSAANAQGDKGGPLGSARPRARMAPINGSVQGLFGKPQYSLRTISA